MGRHELRRLREAAQQPPPLLRNEVVDPGRKPFEFLTDQRRCGRHREPRPRQSQDDAVAKLLFRIDDGLFRPRRFPHPRRQ